MIELHGQITQILLRGSVNVVPSDGSAGWIDTSDATATAGVILKGKTAYAKGSKVTGTLEYIPNGSNTEESIKDAELGTSQIDGVRNLKMSKTITTPVSLLENAVLSTYTPIKNLGDATAADVAEGKTFTSAAGLKVTGTHKCETPSGTISITENGTHDVTSYASANVNVPSGGIDTSDATATAAYILKDKTAYVNGEKVTGSMTNNGAVAKTLDTDTISYTVPAGYHNGSGKVQISTETKTATPTTSSQSITPSSGKVLSEVTVHAIPSQYVDTSDADATAANIQTGKTAYVNGQKITGTHVESTNLDTSDATATAGDIAKNKTAYVNGEKVTGTITTYTGAVTFQDSTVDIGSGIYLTQEITKDILLRTGAKPSFFCDKSNFGDAGKADVLAGKTFTSTAGLRVTGTMPSKAAEAYTPGTSDQTIASGQYLSGAQTIKGDSNLVAGNIKSGVSIFGVSGTYAGSGGSSSGIQAQRITSASETITISGSGTVKVWGYGYKSAQYAGTTYAFVGDGYYSGRYGTPSKTSLTFSISNGKLSGLPAGLTALDVLVTIEVA